MGSDGPATLPPRPMRAGMDPNEEFEDIAPIKALGIAFTGLDVAETAVKNKWYKTTEERVAAENAVAKCRGDITRAFINHYTK